MFAGCEADSVYAGGGPKLLAEGAGAMVLTALVGAEDVVEGEPPKRFTGPGEAMTPDGAEEGMPLPKRLLDGADEAVAPLNRLLVGADDGVVEPLNRLVEGAEGVVEPPNRLLLGGADGVVDPKKVFDGGLDGVVLPNRFVEGAAEAAMPKTFVGAVEVEAPKRLADGALALAGGKALLAGAAEDVPPKVMPEGAAEPAAKALLVEPEGLLGNAFDCAEDVLNKLELGADDALAPPKVILEGADDVLAPPKVMLEGAGDVVPKPLVEGALVEVVPPNGPFAGAEARLPKGLLAPDTLLLPPNMVFWGALLSELPNGKELEKLAVLLAGFCDENGFAAGAAEKLKVPVGGAGEKLGKLLAPAGCWVAGGKL